MRVTEVIFDPQWELGILEVDGAKHIVLRLNGVDSLMTRSSAASMAEVLARLLSHE